jgi:ATP-dependent helicase/nuclease subunit B
VFVLDEYEDPGIRFDSLWVAGLTAATWPRPVAVDPMLPIEIQRRLGMPRVTADACVQEARQILDAWHATSVELVLSWPCRENDTDVDGTPLLPADNEALVPPADTPTREHLALSASRLEPLLDGELPPILGVAPGGARIVELQSQCPFRAFAHLRLRADPLEEPEAGVDRRERGTALHQALHELWAELGSQEALLRLEPAARERRICAAVDRALARVLPDGSGPRTRALEREWQCRAIGRLLALDAARSPFTVVETERSLVGTIGGLDLALRVDRVDRVGDALVVIDYKSGGVRKSPWRGARMEAPQLPLYAALHPARPAAIAIAELGAARAAYRGVSREEGIIESLTPAAEFELNDERGKGFGWERIREHWYAWLERLASDYAHGRTEVDPKLRAETCRSCHLSALCRVAAAPADLVEEGADAD